MSRLQALLRTLPRLQIAAPQPPLNEFSKFPLLPIELRLKVWGIAACEPRVVKFFPSTIDLYKPTTGYTVAGQSKAPAILHTSQEARDEGLKYYEACVQKSFYKGPPGVNHVDWFRMEPMQQTIFVNFAVDVFWRAFMYEFGVNPWRENHTQTFDNTVLNKIQHIHIETRHCGDLDQEDEHPDDLDSLVSQLISAPHVTIVPVRYYHCDTSDGEFTEHQGIGEELMHLEWIDCIETMTEFSNIWWQEPASEDQEGWVKPLEYKFVRHWEEDLAPCADGSALKTEELFELSELWRQ